MTFNGKKILPLLLASILFLGVITFAHAQADECANLPQGSQDKVNCYRDKVNSLSSQVNTLANQVAQFNYQINLTILQIQQTEEKIAMLGGRIGQLEDSLNQLTTAFSSRAIETYKLSRFENNFVYIMTASDISEAVSRFHYLQKIQEADRNLLEKLQVAQTTYKGQKTDQEDLQKQLNQQKVNLDNQKAAKASLLLATQNDENRFQRLLFLAQQELLAFRSYSLGRTQTDANQTMHDDWGYYYAQGDAAWGNIFLTGSSMDTLASSGCLLTSSAMIATHYNRNISPADMAQTPSADWLLYDVTVNGVRIVRNSIAPTVANIDSELSQGRPVIVGLFSACSGGSCVPKHFIVLKSGSNGDYVMYDPLGKDNGYNKPFSSQYNLSDITDVEKVSVQ